MATTLVWSRCVWCRRVFAVERASRAGRLPRYCATCKPVTRRLISAKSYHKTRRDQLAAAALIESARDLPITGQSYKRPHKPHKRPERQPRRAAPSPAPAIPAAPDLAGDLRDVAGELMGGAMSAAGWLATLLEHGSEKMTRKGKPTPDR